MASQSIYPHDCHDGSACLGGLGFPFYQGFGMPEGARCWQCGWGLPAQAGSCPSCRMA